MCRVLVLMPGRSSSPSTTTGMTTASTQGRCSSIRPGGASGSGRGAGSCTWWHGGDGGGPHDAPSAVASTTFRVPAMIPSCQHRPGGQNEAVCGTVSSRTSRRCTRSTRDPAGRRRRCYLRGCRASARRCGRRRRRPRGGWPGRAGPPEAWSGAQPRHTSVPFLVQERNDFGWGRRRSRKKIRTIETFD